MSFVARLGLCFVCMAASLFAFSVAAIGDDPPSPEDNAAAGEDAAANSENPDTNRPPSPEDNAAAGEAAAANSQNPDTNRPPSPEDTAAAGEAAAADNVNPADETAEVEMLGIGDPAPPIAVAQWITGEPIESFEEGQVYVVEFWATWCPPCRDSMPHIAQLQADYGDDVQFIGITDEDLATVEGFLAEEQSEGQTWNDVVTYRLALDDASATNAAYMLAAGQGGIPTAFIVGTDGCIEWIGHPMQMDESLASISEGTWDRAAAIAEFEKQQRIEQSFAQLNQLYFDGKYDEALALLDTLDADLGDSSQTARARLILLQAAGRTEEAAALQAQMVEDAWDDSNTLNQLAWGIAISGDENADLDLAQRAAERAVELTNNESADILDTLARVHFVKGDVEKAIELQTQAVELDANFQPALDEYLAAQEEAAGASDEAP